LHNFPLLFCKTTQLKHAQQRIQPNLILTVKFGTRLTFHSWVISLIIAAESASLIFTIITCNTKNFTKPKGNYLCNVLFARRSDSKDLSYCFYLC